MIILGIWKTFKKDLFILLSFGCATNYQDCVTIVLF